MGQKKILNRTIIQEHLKHIPIFSQLAEETRDSLAKRVNTVELDTKEVFHSPYDRCRHISCIVSGTIKIVRQAVNGKETTLRHIHAGEVFGEIIAFTGKDYPGWLIAVERSVIIDIPVNAILDLGRDRQFFERVIYTLYEKVSYLSQRIYILSGVNIEEKLRRYVVSLYEQQGTVEIYLPMNKTEVANELGCSREALSRLFSDLEKRRVLTSKNLRTCIVDETWLFPGEKNT